MTIKNNSIEKKLISPHDEYKLNVMRKLAFDKDGIVVNHRIYDIFLCYLKQLEKENIDISDYREIKNETKKQR